MRISSFRQIIAIALLGFVCLSMTGGATELEEMLQEAMERNSTVQAARWRVEQALLSHDELMEFFDPALYAAAGEARHAKGVPGSSNNPALTNDSFDVQGGIEQAVQPGFYLSIGGAERWLQDSSTDKELIQTLFGVRVRVPLLRDKGFKTFSLSRQLAMAQYNVAVSQLMQICQQLRLDVELAYISAYESLSSYQVTKEATIRFENLYKEAQELCRLKAVPDYQIFQSQLELQIGREDEEKARLAHEISLVALAKAMGVRRDIVLLHEPKVLFEIASQTAIAEDIPLEQAMESRGDYQEFQNAMEVARLQQDTAEEEKVDELNLVFGAAFQGESDSGPLGTDAIETQRRVGGDVALIWRRPLGNRGPLARIARYGARLSELHESINALKVTVDSDMRQHAMNFRAASQRLKLVQQGIKAAQETVAAELERFRLGENLSSNVTDAQKNLTSILQRQTTAAADLLRARANFSHAIGYAQTTP